LKKTILLTGASGFVGKAFIERYSGQYNIVSVSLREQKPESINFSSVDVVLHLAGLAHSNKRIPAEKYFEINTELTSKLAHAAKSAGVRHFVFLSSVKVYGEDGWFGDSERVLTVDSPCNPVDAYGLSKLAAEKLLHELADINFIVAIVRPCLIYRSDAKGNIASLLKLMKIFRIIPLGFNSNKRSIVEISGTLEWLEKIIKERASGITIPTPLVTHSLTSLIKRISDDSGIRVVVLPIPSFVAYLVIKLSPSLGKRLFGNLVFC